MNGSASWACADPARDAQGEEGRDEDDGEDLGCGGGEGPAPGAKEDGGGAGTEGGIGSEIGLGDLDETVGSTRGAEPPIAAGLLSGFPGEGGGGGVGDEEEGEGAQHGGAPGP